MRKRTAIILVTLLVAALPASLSAEIIEYSFSGIVEFAGNPYPPFDQVQVGDPWILTVFVDGDTPGEPYDHWMLYSGCSTYVALQAGDAFSIMPGSDTRFYIANDWFPGRYVDWLYLSICGGYWSFEAQMFIVGDDPSDCLTTSYFPLTLDPLCFDASGCDMWNYDGYGMGTPGFCGPIDAVEIEVSTPLSTQSTWSSLKANY